MDVVVMIDLSRDERDLLARGLREWGGPAFPTDVLARAMGFREAEYLLADAERIASVLDTDEGLAPVDWARALIATEIAFASDFYGSGWDWSIAAGYDEETTIRRLRSVQKKLRLRGRLPRPQDLSE